MTDYAKQSLLEIREAIQTLQLQPTEHNCNIILAVCQRIDKIIEEAENNG